MRRSRRLDSGLTDDEGLRPGLRLAGLVSRPLRVVVALLLLACATPAERYDEAALHIGFERHSPIVAAGVDAKIGAYGIE